MTPLDDELRSLLQSRAERVAPAADPLGGIERRAKRLRRNRMGASVAAAALVVAGIAVAVPSLVPDRDDSGQVAVTPTPSPTSTATASYGPNELDPVHPWPYRGDKAVLANGNFSSLVVDWRTRHPGSVVNAIYGHVYEPSNRPEIVFVSHATGEERWGVATTSESGIEFIVDEPLPSPSTVLMTPLPGDEVQRLLIVAGPATGDLSYAADGTTFRTVVGTEPGIAFVPLEGDTSHDAVRVLDGDGDLDHPVFLGPAPDSRSVSSTSPAPTQKPANYLEWVTRGTVDPRLEDQAVTAFAQAKATSVDGVRHHVLWGGTDTSGRNLLFMEAWVVGSGGAQTFGMVSTGERFLGPDIAKGTDVLAYLAAGAPGTGTDVLVILPRPGAGQFSYAASAGAPYREVGNARSDLNNVAVIDRDPRATSDRVKVFDGDGMHVLYEGPVQPLLCGASGCG